MDAMGARAIIAAVEDGWTMRVGRKLGRTLYLCHPQSQDPNVDVCVGIVDSEWLAREIRDRWNTIERMRADGTNRDGP